jgi:hypothetical protein
MRRGREWAPKLAQALENAVCRATAQQDDTVLLDVDAGPEGGRIPVLVRRKGPQVECLTVLAPVPLEAPAGTITALCRLSVASGGEFSVFPSNDYRFLLGVRVLGQGDGARLVWACVARLFERVRYWRDRIREIPLH